MATQVQGTFQIDEWDEQPALETEDGAKVTQASVKRSFEGDLTGSGAVEWLMAYDAEGSAVFVGLERFVGEIGGKSGSFVLQHVGTFDGKNAKADLLLVPGTGSGELAGLEARGRFEAGLGPEGERNISLDIELWP